MASPLTCAFWPVRPDVVRDNLARFARASGIAVEPVEIDGDYAAAIEARHAAGAPPDVLYAQRGEASRWAAHGLIEPLDVFPETAAILAEMEPRIRASSHEAGRTLGLTYYNAGPFCLFRNERLLGAVGRGGGAHPSAYPQSWEQVIADARAVKVRGLAAQPLLLRWYAAPTGLPWAFLAECFSEGERLVDAARRPIFGVDTPATLVLERWQAAWRDGLVPDVLDETDAAVDARWMSGAHAFYPTMDYLSALYADPRASAVAPWNHVNPVMPGATHDTLLPGHALLCLSARPRPPEMRAAAWRLLRFLGHRDESGALFVHRRWVEVLNLYVPYPEIYADPAVLAGMRARHHPPLAEHALRWQLAGRARALLPEIVRAPWYLDWSAVLHRLVRDGLLREGRPPRAVVTDLRAAWERLAAA